MVGCGKAPTTKQTVSMAWKQGGRHRGRDPTRAQTVKHAWSLRVVMPMNPPHLAHRALHREHECCQVVVGRCRDRLGPICLPECKKCASTCVGGLGWSSGGQPRVWCIHLHTCVHDFTCSVHMPCCKKGEKRRRTFVVLAAGVAGVAGSAAARLALCGACMHGCMRLHPGNSSQRLHNHYK